MSKDLILKAAYVLTLIVFQINCSDNSTENRYQPTQAETEYEQAMKAKAARIQFLLNPISYEDAPKNTLAKIKQNKINYEVSTIGSRLKIEYKTNIRRYNPLKIDPSNKYDEIKQTIEKSIMLTNLDHEKVEFTMDELIIPCKPAQKDCVNISTTETSFPEVKHKYSDSNELRIELNDSLIINYDEIANEFKSIILFAASKPPHNKLK